MFQFNILVLYNFTSYVRYLHIAVHCIHGALLKNSIVTSANPRAILNVYKRYFGNPKVNRQGSTWNDVLIAQNNRNIKTSTYVYEQSKHDPLF